MNEQTPRDEEPTAQDPPAGGSHAAPGGPSAASGSPSAAPGSADAGWQQWHGATQTAVPGPGPTQEEPFDRLLRALRSLQLNRSDDKWIGGVSGGVAQRLRVDPLIVRAAFILLGLILGAGVTLYLIAWLLLPDPRGSIILERAARHRDGGAIALLVVTIIVASSGFGWFWGWGDGWGPGPIVPLIVVGAVVWAVLARDRRPTWSYPSPGQAGQSGPTGAPFPPSATAPSAPAGGERAPYSTGGSFTYAAPAGPAAPPATTPLPYTGTTPPPPRSTWPTGGAPYGNGPQPPVAPQPPRPVRRPLGAALTWVVLGLAAAVGGATALVLQHTSYDDVAGRVGVAAALGTVGLGVLIAGFAGRRAGFASLVGWVLALVTAVLVVIPKDVTLGGRSGDETWTPASVAAVQSDERYELSTGEGRLDLTRLTAPTAPVTIPAKVSFGHLVVVVPDGVPVQICNHVGLGTIEVDDGIESEVGWKSDTGGTDVRRTVRLGTQPAALTVDANVGMGAITIERESAR
ncbi:PspC domain-containing protein [Luteipulveratus sp. YIM 133132]|uniref:PspC domain-containing protein n=1 Tax=Luteipulveratus flavus TaxID=3031728 RepID=UPI0023AE7261|nr:PspC domain-containing protein [Luteipulveratus sp. YIM 133132]MDE9367143.1 PspC domain-containing protein [Luteipulveratus sp. YIM 133132]